MKKQLKTKLILNKETIARINEEQMGLIGGGQSEINVSVIIVMDPEKEKGCGGPRSVRVSRTCPATATCACTCE